MDFERLATTPAIWCGRSKTCCRCSSTVRQLRPGEGCRYCNVGFDLAGLMIERATGDSYRLRVQTHVFDRAGMADSESFSMDIVEPRVAEGAGLVEEAGFATSTATCRSGRPQGERTAPSPTWSAS